MVAGRGALDPQGGQEEAAVAGGVGGGVGGVISLTVARRAGGGWLRRWLSGRWLGSCRRRGRYRFQFTEHAHGWGLPCDRRLGGIRLTAAVN